MVEPPVQQFGQMGVSPTAPVRLDRAPTPEEVLEFGEPTNGYMCSLTDNIYKIEFNEFNIRDMDSGVQLFHVAKDPNMPDIDPAMIPPELEDQVRCIQYDFGSDFLQLRTIGTQLTFSIGPHEVPNFRMIERHYFRNYLIRSFDFTFGFCIPNTTNTWEAIYELPDLEPELVEDMINNPWETQSDSFYFVDDVMVMHNKAKYAYTPSDY